MRICLSLIILLMLSGCSGHGDASPQVSFYYWKTVFKLTPNEQQTLSRNEVEKLYLRYFDVVVKDGKPVPVSAITLNDLDKSWEIVPVIYIKNEVMSLASLNVKALAENINSMVSKINKRYNINTLELQLDCDWSLKTKDTYFDFLRELKVTGRRKLTATIRLHQIKYLDKTGVPPVDGGVLMFYNMSKIGPGLTNSIYERSVSRQYISSVSRYPLPLSIALPIFSWGIHIRNNKVIGLVNKVNFKMFEEDDHFEMKSSPFFEVIENVAKLGHYFKKGDLIKIESVGKSELDYMVDDLSDRMGRKPQEIIFYDLDEFNLKLFNDDETFFKNLSSSF